MYENFIAKNYQSATSVGKFLHSLCSLGHVKTQDWNEISDKTFYLENEELLLRNTFLNARMGPLAEFAQNMPTYQHKSRDRIVWADEKGFSLTQHEPLNVETQVLKPSAQINKQTPFGPKYTSEGKL